MRRTPLVTAAAVALCLGLMLVVAGCSVGYGEDELADPGCGQDPTGPAGLVGFEPNTGDEVWSTPIGPLSGVAPFPDVIVVSSNRSIIRAFDTATGEPLWCAEVEPVPDDAGERSGGVVRSGQMVVTFSGDAIIALDPASGDEHWRVPFGPADAFLQSGDDAVWLHVQNNDGSTVVTALDPTTGIEASPTPERPTQPPSFVLGLPVSRVGEYELVRESVQGTQTQELLISVTQGREPVSSWQVPGFIAAFTPPTWITAADADSTGDAVAGGTGAAADAESTGDAGETGTGATAGAGTGSIAAAAEPLVLVIDQTNGTGSIPASGAQTLLSAYRLSGAKVWDVPLPGTPHLLANVSDSIVVIPVGAVLYGIDINSGQVLWEQDHGSPGRTGAFNQDGTYSFISDAPPGVSVGLIQAERPYSD